MNSDWKTEYHSQRKEDELYTSWHTVMSFIVHSHYRNFHTLWLQRETYESSFIGPIGPRKCRSWTLTSRYLMLLTSWMYFDFLAVTDVLWDQFVYLSYGVTHIPIKCSFQTSNFSNWDIKHPTVCSRQLCQWAVFKLGTVDYLHLFEGPGTEGLGVCMWVCVCVFGLWSGTDCFNLSSMESSWNRELL